MSKTIDTLVNNVASFFSRSSSRQGVLRAFEKELDYGTLRTEAVVATRWLSRHGAIAKLCDILEPVLMVFQREDVGLFNKLREFEMIYCLHFLADILQIMTSLSLDFQKTQLDVTMVHGICLAAVTEIEVCFSESGTPDLNGYPVDSKGYPVIPDYGTDSGALSALRGAVKGTSYRGVQMIRDEEGEDLRRALEFQYAFSASLIDTLKKRMGEQSVLFNMKVLCPNSLPLASRDIKEYGQKEIAALAEFYGTPTNGVDALVDPRMLKVQFAKWKYQAAEWRGKSFIDHWGYMHGTDMYKDKFPSLLKVALAGMMQCSSTAACEGILQDERGENQVQEQDEHNHAGFSA
ncbi:hypothetical protein L7F22_036055 [Adiantum nelumboides]|nr:hypothetical protein [Adiantum nelumboides]